MLVLTRRTNQRVYIPAIDTWIQVVDARAGSVRLGFQGPKDVRIYREEVNPRQSPQSLSRALVVEDDQNERELLAAYLRLAGLDVITAGDGAEALDCLNGRSGPDVLFLDMVLPRCDGPSTVRRIRANPALSGMTIVGMTGHEPERFRSACGDGVNHWFRKPLNPDDVIRKLLGHQPSPS